MMSNSIVFHCKKCARRIQIPLTMISVRPEHRGSSPKEPLPLALSCEHCKHVDIYVLKENSPFPDNAEDRVELSPQTSFPGFWYELECEDKNCNTPLRVSAPRNTAMNAKELEKDASTWAWDVLRCPSGHLIPLPRKE